MKLRNILIIFIFYITPFATASEQVTSEVITIKTPEQILSKQNLPYFHGISAETAGSNVLSMNLVIIPPGASAEAHYHDGFESAVYVIKGRVETRYGDKLQYSVINESGDFIYIPPNLPHQPKNLSSTEQAIAIVSRNDPNEQESVIPHTIK